MASGYGLPLISQRPHVHTQQRHGHGPEPSPAHSDHICRSIPRYTCIPCTHTHKHTHTLTLTPEHTVCTMCALPCTAAHLLRPGRANGYAHPLSAPPFLSPRWDRGGGCCRGDTSPEGMPGPAAAPQGPEGAATSLKAPGSGLLGSPGGNCP